ncbi:MAG TPA: type I-A CRISPR-associated protein Csa5 [Candidatus Atribacteria bacterium]|nr:type I-A CRISPR-associated protein Csa5 [Candidatus Atribacteria bacterium]
MSIELFTPIIGYPDLEIKIAYGLARIGIEADCEPCIIPQNSFYKIVFKDCSIKKINETFLLIAKRLLSSDRFFNLGIKAKDKSKYPVNPNTINRLEKIDIIKLYNSLQIENSDFKRTKLCGHRNLPKFGAVKESSKLGGLVLLTSSHAGKPYFRNRRFDTFNLSLCETCGYLAVLGLFSFGFFIQMGSGKNRKYGVVLPIPRKVLKNENLLNLLSLQKTLHNFWLSDLQPLRTFTISLLAKVPSLSDIVNNFQLNFHLSLASKDNRGDTIIEQTALIDTMLFSHFISSSSYNSATVIKLLGTSKMPPKISSLTELSNILLNHRTENLLRFVRLYVVPETSTNNWKNLLYLPTAKYLLKEIAMISPEIIENPSLGSLARTLRYFIRERKYGYADNIRNAGKESKDFEETIAKMLREGRLRLEQKKKIHLPTDEEVKEVFKLANDNFEKTKIALVILAFSFPAKIEDEMPENIEEEAQND